MTVRLEPSVLRELLSCDIFTGCLTWKPRELKWFKTQRDCNRWNTKYSGKIAFNTENENGYLTGTLFNKTYLTHRVIWCLCFGYWPDEVDHENGNKLDNRLVNLKLSNRKSNAKNLKISVLNTSGVVGVRIRNLKWVASIVVNGKSIHLGRFTEFYDAVSARKQAEIDYGFHANHGKR